jgi:UV DNA damage endonuclease
MTAKKIGFACKMSRLDARGQVESVPELNTRVTTVAWLKRQSRAVAEERLWDLMRHNIESIRLLIKQVGALDESLRMVRLSSDLLPVYTEPTFSYFWQQPDVVAYAEREFARAGDTARTLGVRLSFHPGQFCVMASTDPGIVDRSIAEFEYHATMARYMGYGKQFQDFKINVHIAGRQGPMGILSAYQRLSPEARNTLTIENEENAWGLDDCLVLADTVPIVLDVHHHWVKTGEYIQPTDSRVNRVVDSWRGVRPVMHYSYSRDENLPSGFGHATAPDMAMLLEQGHKKQRLRAHSDYYPNQAVNDWALGFLDRFDVMCESKAKNLASFALASRARELGIIS